MLGERVGFGPPESRSADYCTNRLPDVASGPTNLGYNEQEVRQVVEASLRYIGLEDRSSTKNGGGDQCFHMHSLSQATIHVDPASS